MLGVWWGTAWLSFLFTSSLPLAQLGRPHGDMHRTRDPCVASQALEMQWGLTDAPAPALSSPVPATPHFIDEEAGPRM